MTGVGRGKLILVGEHAVVYGHPALALGVDRKTTVTLSPSEGLTAIQGATDARLLDALRRALPALGFDVRVESDLPIGRGMGSSAALAVALVRARGGSLPPEELYRAALEIECVFHGNPSGLDVWMAIHGGVVRFRRGPPREVTPLPPPSWQLVVIDSADSGDTRSLVASVAAQRPDVDPILADIGALVVAAEKALHQPDQLGPLLTENHRLLARIGVSSPRLDSIVSLALEAGALGAKLSGAGGGGVVIALTDAAGDEILAAATAAGLSAFVVRPELT